MKILCSRDELAAMLGVVSRAVSARATVQILSGVLLRTEGGRLELAATDMELSLRASVAADVASEGSVVVPGRLLTDLVRLLPTDKVDIVYREGHGVVEITCGAATYHLHTYNPEDFPRLPDITTATVFSIGREVLLETVARVSRSASRDESRPVLTGILVRFESGKVIMAATDSYRLSVKESTLDGPVPELEAIVPARALIELQRIAPPGDELKLGVLENQVVFGAGGIWLTTRRIDGQFPNYKLLLPESFAYELTLPRAELLDVVRRTSVMAQRNSPLHLHFSEGELTVSAQTQDVGEARESLPISFGGEPFEIGFNPDFLREGIESVASEEIHLKLNSPLRPGVIQAEGDNFWYLIMPIRLAG